MLNHDIITSPRDLLSHDIISGEGTFTSQLQSTAPIGSAIIQGVPLKKVDILSAANGKSRPHHIELSIDNRKTILEHDKSTASAALKRNGTLQKSSSRTQTVGEPKSSASFNVGKD